MKMPVVNYDDTPFLVIWEVTQACDLACSHCRASAQPEPLQGELTPSEGRELITSVSQMGCPILVLSGGDPLKRIDLEDLIQHGKNLGLTVATIPAATPMLTQKRLQSLRDSGLDQLAFSLDFPSSDLHDSFRGVPGAFELTMKGIQWAHDLQIPLQINTTITAQSLPYLEDMAKFVSSLGIVFWEVFFLVPTGRGKDLASLSANECEQAFFTLHQLHRECSFILKVTEAPHYRRFVAQQENTGQGLHPRLMRSEGPGHSMGRAPSAVNAGKGFLFVAHDGEVFPSGFLPISAGNVKKDVLSEIYRRSPLFRDLRDGNLLKGRCGRCEYKDICGGSRSRAYALTGDFLETDDWCIYQPSPDQTSTK